jgi:ribosomal peptide maturation radical SAM protein 1
MKTAPHTALVSMPWAPLSMPSVQVGTLTAVLQRAGLPVTPFSLFLELMLTVWGERSPLTARDYLMISEMSWPNGLGDWLFAMPPGPEARASEAYAARVAEEEPELYELGLAFRAHVPAFIERAAAAVLAAKPDIVGFTSTFNQTLASVHLATVLKRERPDLVVVLGGANCDGPMGAALLRTFDAIDYTYRGEAEHGILDLVRLVGEGGSPSGVAGLSYRDGASVVSNDAGRPVTMADVPMPDYREYFARMSASPHRYRMDPIAVPVETSRGCWWGAKHHCTFCGLNGSTMAFRSKDPAVVTGEFEELSNRHGCVTFQTVDNILDLRYFSTVLPALAGARERGHDYKIFYETKANLRKHQVRTLRDAGVYMIQPGIESLSTPVLRLMDKGVTALQNIRLLKWAAEYDISVTWNLLYGFPGERPEHYTAMAELIPSVSHLAGPAAARILLERFSPYFVDAERYGIEITGPVWFYEHLYAAPREVLMDLAYEFEYGVGDLGDCAYVKPVQDALDRYWGKTVRAPKTLQYQRGPGFVRVADRRKGLPVQDVTLRGVSAFIFLACDAGATVPAILQGAAQAGFALGEIELRAFLKRLVAIRLMYEEDGLYLSLPVATRPVADLADVGGPQLLRGGEERPAAVERIA